VLNIERHGTDEYPGMHETWSYGQGDTKVARIDISGVIIQGKQGSIFSVARDPVETAVRMIRTATKDKNIKGIILVVDSPGGGITASDIIYNELRKFKKIDPARKIVALLGDVAASGGYYVASAADYIVAHPTTITGSIGVLISTLNFKGFGDKYGIKSISITSGKNKDMLNPLKDLTEEQQKLLQFTIDDMYRRFVSVVSEGRSLPEEEVRKIADGRIFTASEALNNKLIDRIGYWDEAMEETCNLLKAKAIKVIRYQEPFTFTALFEAIQNIDVSIRNLQGTALRMYLSPL
jgi:protease-4